VPTGRLALVLVTLAVLPDLDVLGFHAGIPYEHPLGHRGLSHSLLFALVVGLGATRRRCRNAKP
jgi:inner membrane protein